MASKYERLYWKNTEKISSPIRTKIETLAVTHHSWSGVWQSLEGNADEICDIGKLKERLYRVHPKRIIFGGLNSSWLNELKLAKYTGSEVIVSLQHTPVLHCFGSENREATMLIIKAYRDKLIDEVWCPHPGLSLLLSKYGIMCEHMVNTLKDPLKRNKKEGINIGIFGSGMPWKNYDTQLLAAGLVQKYKNNVTIHSQGGSDAELENLLNIKVKHYTQLPKPLFLDLAGSMTVNMAVGLTETFGYMAIESFLMEVPCLYYAGTPSMDDAPLALKTCEVSRIDDPLAIHQKLMAVIENHKAIGEYGREWAMRFVV